MNEGEMTFDKAVDREIDEALNVYVRRRDHSERCEARVVRAKDETTRLYSFYHDLPKEVVVDDALYRICVRKSSGNNKIVTGIALLGSVPPGLSIPLVGTHDESATLRELIASIHEFEEAEQQEQEAKEVLLAAYEVKAVDQGFKAVGQGFRIDYAARVWRIAPMEHGVVELVGEVRRI